MTSFLLSALGRRFHGSTLEQFQAVHLHDWIVWEPGVWRPPRVDGTTMSAARLATPAPSDGEALSMALVPRKNTPGQLTLGRAPTNDLEINDATLSQLHLLFMEGERGHWTVRDAGSKNGSWLEGVQLRAGQPATLEDGARVQAAQVCLTYYRPAGLMRRLGTLGLAGTWRSLENPE
jgi:hypothetical protein